MSWIAGLGRVLRGGFVYVAGVILGIWSGLFDFVIDCGVTWATRILADVEWLDNLAIPEPLVAAVEMVNYWLPVDTVLVVLSGVLAFEAALWVYRLFRGFVTFVG